MIGELFLGQAHSHLALLGGITRFNPRDNPREEATVYIGETAKQTGLSVKAIRFYEDIGLIQAPKREGRYRVYDDTDVELLTLIREAKELGIPLARLKGVVIFENGEVNWSKIKTFLEEVRADLVLELEALQQKIAALDDCYQQINC